MIDIHSHILPEIDDGSRNEETTLEMLRIAAESGTKEIVATPHFCRGYGEAYYEDVKKLVEDIQVLADKAEIDIKIYHGQEVYYSEKMIEDYAEGIIGTINDSRYMLFELTMTSKLDEEVFDILYEMQVRGIVLILAHPERYKFIMEKPWLINRFIDEGILFQLNSGSIEGKFGEKVKKTASILLSNGIYNFIGSDAHNIRSRKPGISEGIKLAKDKNKLYRKLFEDSAAKLLNDEKIEFVGKKIKEKRSFLSFFK
ncbi:MAG: capsular biosynthesis protein [Clostridium sp.]|nr:capsular biosynthesis protein [Clostridium sp.]